MKAAKFFTFERSILIFFTCCFVSSAHAQPGGVGGGLSLWYDFNDVSTLFQDVAGTTPVTTDGQPVYRINDLSGNGNNAQLSNVLLGAAAAATYESDAASTINGNTVIRFNSGVAESGDIYDVPGMDLRAISTTDATIFTVYKVSENTPNPFYGIWGNDNGNWDRFYMASAGFFPGAVPTDGLVSLGGATQGALIPGGGDIGQVRLLTAVYDGNLLGNFNAGVINGSKIYFNGIQQVQFTDMSDALDAQPFMRIGNDGDNHYYVGDLAEMIIYDRVLTDAELNLVNCYLSQKYDQNYVVSPGGVAACDLRLWLKADLGTDVTTGDVSIWEDQSIIQGIVATQAGVTQKPEFVSAGMNYNPSLLFDEDPGNEDELNIGSNLALNGSSQVSTVVVSKTSDALTGILGPESSAAGTDMEIFGGNVYGMNDAGATNIVSGTTPTSDNVQHIGSFVQSSILVTLTTDGGDQQFGINFGTWDGDNYDIGRSHNTNGSDAEIAEVIVFNSTLSNADLSKVQSYVAIKYGITLDASGGGIDGDYTASDGQLLWNASVNNQYHNDVIGIGRDDIQGLLQKQSHTIDDSSRIYIDNLMATNIANSGSITNDISYVLMGHNEGIMCNTVSSVAEIPTGLANCDLFSRLEREWKLTKTNFSQNFNLTARLNSCANTGAVNVSDLRLLVDDDGDFSNGGTSCYYNGDGTGIVISYNGFVIDVANLSTTHFADNSTRYWTIGSIEDVTPLPIELGNSEILCENGQPVLHWSTISETNNAFFEIERSRDLQQFETVGVVQGTGNSTQMQEYSWTDVAPLPGVGYYRLSQTDVDGTRDFLAMASVDCQQDELVSVFPNPFENEITVTSQYGASIKVLDGSGRLVYEQKISAGKTHISLDSVTSGLYFIHFKLDNGDNEIRKIIRL